MIILRSNIKEVKDSNGLVISKIIDHYGHTLYEKQTGVWKLDEDGFIIGSDGKYYQRFYDDSKAIDNNPIPDLNGEWVPDTVSGSLNIDTNFDYYMSNSNYHVGGGYSQFKVTWSGLTEVTFLYRSKAESSYDYMVINGMDKPKFTSKPSYNTSGILAHTRSKQTDTYNTITIPCSEDEHFIWVCYLKDGSGNTEPDRAFFGIPNIYKTGEIFYKQGSELRYEYLKSTDVVITREGYGKFKYYKWYYSPNNEHSWKTEVYTLGEEEPLTSITRNYLRFEAKEGNVEIGWGTPDLTPTSPEYAIDFEETWQPWDLTTVQLEQGHTMYVRASGLPISSNSTRRFTTSDVVECHGDCRSLLSKDSFETRGLSYSCFSGLFQTTKITTAPTLPATTLHEYCYADMFKGCINLTTAPTLPATTLYRSCYRGMFQSCSSLTAAPVLPATTLAENCYSNMFYRCTSLTTAPELPATTLAPYCYGGYYTDNGMFSGCTSLTTAPSVLPATTLAQGCYQYMFVNCKSLTTAPTLPATELANSCYYAMFSGCTSLTTAPSVLPATELANSCYSGMFSDCTSLTTAPTLPATTLASSCYYRMFTGCSKLSEVKCNIMYNTDGTTVLTSSIGVDWMMNVKNKSDCIFYKNPNWSGPTSRSYSTVLSNWTIVDWVQD